MAPAAISARPAVTTMAVESMTPETPAARANGTVRPSDIPITMSLTIALAVKCCSTCGVSGMALPGRHYSLSGASYSHDQHGRFTLSSGDASGGDDTPRRRAGLP